jgi:hypothetical protein
MARGAANGAVSVAHHSGNVEEVCATLPGDVFAPLVLAARAGCDLLRITETIFRSAAVSTARPREDRERKKEVT